MRRAAIQKPGAASQATEVKGGNVLHEYPEFLLPFLIQVRVASAASSTTTLKQLLP